MRRIGAVIELGLAVRARRVLLGAPVVRMEDLDFSPAGTTDFAIVALAHPEVPRC